MPASFPDAGAAMDRRTALKASLLAAGASLMAQAPASAQATKPDPRRASPKRYAMKKSINLWAFPYPERMNLRECLQLAKDAGFDGIELNYDLDNDLSPEGIRRHPQAGGFHRHSNQRAVLVPLLAVSAHEQRSRQARPGRRAGRQDRTGRA
jgi:hypothetical protein